MDHPFDLALHLEAQPDGTLRGRTSEAYWNFVSPYGGVTAATVLRAILLQPQQRGDPLSMTVNFAAAIQPGELIVRTELVRATRSTQHWAVRILQGDASDTMVSAIALCGVRRRTFSLTEAVAPCVPAPDTLPRVRPMQGMQWPDRYEMRYVRGRLMEANDDSITHAWLRDEPPRALDFLSLTSMCDAFFPRLFLRRPQFVPVATVSLNIYFHVDALVLAQHGEAPVLASAQAQVFSDGYFDQQGQIWGPKGVLLATTQQIVWYKE
jgi:acyl-CoA thioesterase